MTKFSTTEKQLREQIASFARSQIGEASVIDDFLQSYGSSLGFSRVRQIVTEEYEAVRQSAAARLASGARTARPELEIDDDGMAEALRLAGWEVRWNVTARRVEARHGDDWHECTGLVRDQMMTDASKVAVMRRGWRVEPWRIPSVRLEDRLLAVVAARHQFEGKGTPVYEAVREWACGLRGGARAIRLADALIAAGVLQKFEAAVRAPKSVFADAARALSDLGWEYKSTRLPSGPRNRWVSPGPRGTLPLGVVADSTAGDYNATTAKVLGMKEIYR